MKQIHICHISQSAGGVEQHILGIINYCDKNKFRHTVICYNNGTLAATAREAGAEIRLVPMVREISPYQDLLSLGRIILELRKLRPHLIHAHSGKGGLFGRLAGMMSSIPVVFTPNAFSYLSQQGFKRSFLLNLERMLALTPAVMAASSTSEALRAIREVWWLPRKVTDCFPDHPSPLMFRGEMVQHFPKNEIKVLMIARLSHQKNPEMLLRVAALTREQSPDINFNILGGGYGDELGQDFFKMVAALGLTGVVKVIPWGDSAAVENELLNSDIYVSTSRYESFGIATAEAMSKGIPVVATRIDGSIDLVDHNETGFLVDLDDDGQMAERVLQLAKDHRLRKRMGAAAKNKIERCYDIQKNIKYIESLYLGLANKRFSAANLARLCRIVN